MIDSPNPKDSKLPVMKAMTHIWKFGTSKCLFEKWLKTLIDYWNICWLLFSWSTYYWSIPKMSPYSVKFVRMAASVSGCSRQLIGYLSFCVVQSLTHPSFCRPGQWSLTLCFNTDNHTIHTVALRYFFFLSVLPCLCQTTAQQQKKKYLIEGCKCYMLTKDNLFLSCYFETFDQILCKWLHSTQNVLEKKEIWLQHIEKARERTLLMGNVYHTNCINFWRNMWRKTRCF